MTLKLKEANGPYRFNNVCHKCCKKYCWLKESTCFTKKQYLKFICNVFTIITAIIYQRSHIFYLFLFFRFFLFFLPVFCFFAGDSSVSESEFCDCDETVMADCCPAFNDELCGEFSAAERYGTTLVLLVHHLISNKYSFQELIYISIKLSIWSGIFFHSFAVSF